MVIAQVPSIAKRFGFQIVRSIRVHRRGHRSPLTLIRWLLLPNGSMEATRPTARTYENAKLEPNGTGNGGFFWSKRLMCFAAVG